MEQLFGIIRQNAYFCISKLTICDYFNNKFYNYQLINNKKNETDQKRDSKKRRNHVIRLISPLRLGDNKRFADGHNRNSTYIYLCANGPEGAYNSKQ